MPVLSDLRRGGLTVPIRPACFIRGIPHKGHVKGTHTMPAKAAKAAEASTSASCMEQNSIKHIFKEN